MKGMKGKLSDYVILGSIAGFAISLFLWNFWLAALFVVLFLIGVIFG